MQSHTVPNYIVGSILWLPPKAEIPFEYRYEANTIEEGCFNHPVLILSVDQAKTEVVILIVRQSKLSPDMFNQFLDYILWRKRLTKETFPR